MMDKLSIIIPNFNNEKYIEECLQSIINYEPLANNVEIIIVDDNSDDNSCEIVENIANNTNTDIKLIKNKIDLGTGLSRNRGVGLAKYPYILFIDGDDMIIPEVIYECLEIISVQNNEVVFFDMEDYINGVRKTNPYSQISMYGFDRYNFNIDVDEHMNIMFGWSSCRFIIEKEFLIGNNLKFYDSSICEDGYFVADMYNAMNDVSVVNKVGYLYRCNSDKLPLDEKTLNTMFEIYENIMDNHYYDDILYYQLLYQCLPQLIHLTQLDVIHIKKYYEPILDKIPVHIMEGLFDLYKQFYYQIMNENQQYFDNIRGTGVSSPKLLSIILPTYNSEKYIGECLYSIMVDKELFDKVELIIIDDNSSDNTLNIVKEKVGNLPNCKIVSNTSNKGSGYCRNKGLELATSPYILFVDNDDMIIPSTINKALEIINKEKTNVIFFDTVDLVGNKLKTPKYSYINMFNIDKDKIITKPSNMKNIMFGWSPWHYIADRNFIFDNDIKFGRGSLGDDIYYTSKIYCKMEKISIINDVGYIHRIGSGISRNKHQKEHFKKYVEVFSDILEKYNYNEMIYWEILYLELLKGIKIDNITVKELNSIINTVYSKIPSNIKEQMFYLYKRMYDIIENEDEIGFIHLKGIFDRGLMR